MSTDEVHLSPSQHRLALAFARAILPDWRGVPGGDERSALAAARFARDAAPGGVRAFAGLLQMFEHAALLYRGSRFSRLDPVAQDELLKRWQRDPLLHRPLYILAFLYKASHFDHASLYEAMDCMPFAKGGPPEPARWLSQVMPGDQIDETEPIECDVVIMGTGAGGAVVGKELAELGYAVVFVEEGDLHRRDSFTGSVLDAKRVFYRGKAAIAAIGNAVIPTFMGRLVGGSTAINTATCFHTPDWILEQWCEQLQTDIFRPDKFARHFERVERTLFVEPVKPELRGGLARVVARGCDELGWRHHPIRRNAPDCDAQGVCDFGCPSGARRSMDISYIPPALMRGSVLLTGMRGTRVMLDAAGRCQGLEAQCVRTGKKLQVRARAVVLAGGSVPTPMFLLNQGICNRSDQVGRNLSLHPACSISALFDEEICGHQSIPQSYFSDQFHREGIMMLGASTPLSLSALMLPHVGRELMEMVEGFKHIASLGIMIGDESRGRVRVGRDGAPLLTYRLERGDTERLKQGLVHAAEIFFAAGAKQVYPMLTRKVVVNRHEGVEPLRAMRLNPFDIILTSFHPLGTCRMGHDPATSVVGFDHQTHEVPGLFIVDGSTVPGPPAVNPQITVMAMADRAAGQIAAKLG